jgi:hypothetical protein
LATAPQATARLQPGGQTGGQRVCVELAHITQAGCTSRYALKKCIAHVPITFVKVLTLMQKVQHNSAILQHNSSISTKQQPPAKHLAEQPHTMCSVSTTPPLPGINYYNVNFNCIVLLSNPSPAALYYSRQITCTAASRIHRSREQIFWEKLFDGTKQLCSVPQISLNVLECIAYPPAARQIITQSTGGLEPPSK